MDAKEKQLLMLKAEKIRLAVIEGTYHAKSGHPGGSLSIAEDLAYLYWREMRIDPREPHWPDRDRLVLSKGHAAPALYGALALRGYFSTDLIPTLRHVGSILQGHPDMKHIPGVDMSSGSLGQVYTIVGDGEIQEGQVWEAAMFAAAKKLDNLVVLVDNNNLQIDGTVEEVNSPYPIPEKFAAFGFHVVEIDGNDLEQIESALAEARTVKGKPTAVIQKTVKGKGVSYMENQCGWHGSAPKQEQYEIAVAEITARIIELEG